ncbi:MAG: alpha/beta fold hydrolase [Ilumatobacteraceae bacterium]|nr:alpha/beta fold hydrolase [Ilumatobacteraceae bacterium]
MTPRAPRAEDRRLHTFERSGLLFDVREDGPGDGPPVVLLHGWPGGASTWDLVAPALAEAGYRTLSPDQRGYSPGARPSGRRAYRMDELVADIIELLDDAALDQVHLVGHDWGGAVAWTLAARFPERVASLTVLSTPHPLALARSLWSSDQILRSSYIGLFQLPVVPESLLLARDATVLRAALRRSGLPGDVADAYGRRQQDPGALSASLAWYRAVPVGSLPAGDVSVPTRFLWGSRDSALGRRAAELTGDHVNGRYRFDLIEGATHWLPELHAGLVAAAVDEHARTSAAPQASAARQAAS